VNAAAADYKRPPGLKGTTLHVIKFDTGSVEISPEDQAWLQAQAERFQSHPGLEVCVIGQADKTGDTELNKKLSLDRAEAVAAFLKATPECRGVPHTARQRAVPIA